MKIKIIEHEGNKWSISFGSGSPKKRIGAFYSIKRLEAYLLRQPGSELKEKMSVETKTMNGEVNETMSSAHAPYLVGTTLIFLEDYVSKEFYKEYFKKYGKEINNF